MRLLCSLLTVAACLGPAVLQAQTCAERADAERALIAAIPDGQIKNIAAATVAVLAAHDALKAECLKPAVPPQPQISPVGTRTPPAPSVTDAKLNVWTIGPQEPANTCGPTHPEWCHKVFKNGVWLSGVYGSAVMLGYEAPPKVYLVGDDGLYYQETATGGFISYGPNPPPPPIPPGGLIIKPAAVAAHDGLVAAPWELWYRLYIDGQAAALQPRNNAWADGLAWISIPKTAPSGDHAIQIAAVFICPPGASCGYAERESARSLPPVLLTVP